jgi:ankyrin repeat protein
MFWAAQEGRVDVIKILAKLGADINSPNNNGVTPITIAAGEGHLDVIIKVLYKFGADMKPDCKLSLTEFAQLNKHTEAHQLIKKKWLNYLVNTSFVAVQISD